MRGELCSLIIDSGSCTNVVSSLLVEKMNLHTLKHPNPYKLQWLNECGEIKVKKQVKVAFSIGKYHDEILCDVAPMQAGHILLGRPWQYDRKVNHDGHKNMYKFVMKNQFIRLVPLSPLEAFQDRARIAAEFKMRRKKKSDPTKQESERKSGESNERKKDSGSGKHMRVTNTRVSAFVIRSEERNNRFVTNRDHSTLPRVNVSLLQVNEGCFPKKIPKKKPMKRLDSRTNQLKEGGNDTRKAKAWSKTSKNKFKAKDQVSRKCHEGQSSARLPKLEFQSIGSKGH